MKFLLEKIMTEEYTGIQKHIQLSWDLIGYKMMYYYPEEVDTSWHKKLTVTDEAYDTLEKEYLRLCLELGIPNTVAGQSSVDGKEVRGEGMTQIDLERPSVRLAKFKFSNRRIN